MDFDTRSFGGQNLLLVARPKHELADVIRQFMPKIEQKMLSHHRNTLHLLRDCRTAAMGGHLDACKACGQVRVSYNSCRNRHCPKCQGLAKEAWTVQQEDMLLPVSYFHVVFTLPHELNILCLHNPKMMYNLLFQSAWHTLHTLGQNKHYLDAQTAATMVLHTWSQTLVLHPHVHCIVPGGGLSKEGEWRYPKRSKKGQNFLFPVVAMKKIYKGFFMKNLKKAIENQQVRLPKTFPTGRAYKLWKDNLYSKEWVVYTKKPFSKVEHVVGYLARYSHRVALTNHRIKNIDESNVTFEYKDYKDGAKKKEMMLEGGEFLRRFCLHILPKAFRKIRQFGFLSNATKKKSIEQARASLGQRQAALLTRNERKALAKLRVFGSKIHQCPACKIGKMLVVEQWQRNKSPPIWIISLDKNT